MRLTVPLAAAARGRDKLERGACSPRSETKPGTILVIASRSVGTELISFARSASRPSIERERERERERDKERKRGWLSRSAEYLYSRNVMP